MTGHEWAWWARSARCLDAVPARRKPLLPAPNRPPTTPRPPDSAHLDQVLALDLHKVRQDLDDRALHFVQGRLLHAAAVGDEDHAQALLAGLHGGELGGARGKEDAPRRLDLRVRVVVGGWVGSGSGGSNGWVACTRPCPAARPLRPRARLVAEIAQGAGLGGGRLGCHDLVEREGARAWAGGVCGAGRAAPIPTRAAPPPQQQLALARAWRTMSSTASLVARAGRRRGACRRGRRGPA